jgi:hypothetical protein
MNNVRAAIVAENGIDGGNLPVSNGGWPIPAWPPSNRVSFIERASFADDS